MKNIGDRIYAMNIKFILAKMVFLNNLEKYNANYKN